MRIAIEHAKREARHETGGVREDDPSLSPLSLALGPMRTVEREEAAEVGAALLQMAAHCVALRRHVLMSPGHANHPQVPAELLPPPP